MAYQALYRRYRPRRFAELRGQEHVVRALRNAVRDGRVGHAYLFSGPRGTGKTSSARVLAKVLNCENPIDGEPCCACASCLAVEAGTSFDVHEHDAASARGIDDMRAILDTVHLATPGRTKVYILDEVHQLTAPAVAALLKTLEEPPEHVVFVLATTDPQKVPDTVRSRTQHLPFHLLPSDELAEHVRWVAGDAGIVLDEHTLEAILRQGAGSARDTLSALDQMAAAGGVDEVGDVVDEVIAAVADGDTAQALAGVASMVGAGRDARTITEAIVRQLRDVFLIEFAPALVALPDAAKARVQEQRRLFSGRAAITRAMEMLGEILVEMRHAPDPRLLLEVAIVKLTNVEADPSPAALLERIERLEHQLASGAQRTAPSREPPKPREQPASRESRESHEPAARPEPRDTAPPPPSDDDDPGDNRSGPAAQARAILRRGNNAGAPRGASGSNPPAPRASGAGRRPEESRGSSAPSAPRAATQALRDDAATTSPSERDDATIDLTELRDAPPNGLDGMSVAALFPGAEWIEEKRA